MIRTACIAPAPGVMNVVGEKTTMKQTSPYTPDTSNLVPMTYAEATAFFYANGKRRFSFLAGPYGVLKTTVLSRSQGLVAAPPSSVDGGRA